MNERNVLKLDANKLKHYQKDLHEGSINAPEVESRFSCRIEKQAWSSHMKVKMSHSAEEGEVIYTASKKFDNLFKCEMHIHLLPVKVKDQYKNFIEICYPHNLGHNIAYEGELRIDDDPINTIDNVWMDIYTQYFMKSSKRDH